MTTFLQVSDPVFPAIAPWWTALLPHNDHDTLLRLHKLFSRQFWINDGHDPHNQAERDRAAEEGVVSLANLRHPAILSAKWMTTALSLFVRGDVLVSSRGGMRPRDGSLKEIGTIESNDWPASFSPTRQIAITTWGKHYYLVCGDIAFAEKHNTEENAMRVAKLFASADHITVKREARDYREGD